MDKKGKILGIVSFKGGVGKTTSAINLAASLKKLNHDVAIVDANFTSPNLHAYFGLFNPAVTMNNVIKNENTIENAIYRDKSGIHIIPCTFKDATLDITRFREEIKGLKGKYDYIIIDSSPNLNEDMLATLMTAEELIFIATPDYPTLLSTMKASEIVRRKNLNLRGIIINKKRNKKFELKKADIEKVAKANVIAEIEDDIGVMEAVSEFKNIIDRSPNGKTAKKYLKIASDISGRKIEIKKPIKKKIKVIARPQLKIIKRKSIKKRRK